MNLKGKRALVTGATKGIGLAVAEKLVGEGCDVVICARTESEVVSVSRHLAETRKTRVRGKACDIGDSEQVRDLVGFCREALGGLEILINNAGVGIFESVQDMSVENWRKTIGTNLDGVFFCCHYALPVMKEVGEGFIVNIASLAGKNAFPKGAAYNASKFGLVGFSEALMQEVRHDNIRVAYGMPGSVDTWFGGHAPEGEESWKLSALDVADVVVDTLRRHPRCLTSRIEMRPSRPPLK